MPGPSAALHHTCLPDPSPAPFPFSGHAPDPQCLSVVRSSKLKTGFEVQAHLADCRSEYSPCIQTCYSFDIGSNPSTAHFQKKTPEELLRSGSIFWSHSSHLPRKRWVYICTCPHVLKYSFALLPPTFQHGLGPINSTAPLFPTWFNRTEDFKSVFFVLI